MPVFLSDRQLRILFYTAWLLLLLIQCALVGLSGDEAYYWRYSKQLAWGYFDHPPVTALLIKAGYLLFKNELGVRLFFGVAVTGFIYGVERLVNPSNLRLFYAMVLSVAFLQIGMVWGGGMMALPDFPLLFFEVLFFFLYQRYLDRPTLAVCIAIPIVVASMLLSKYHGVLVVGFVVLSNLRLLTKPSFWLMCIGVALLLVPHALWQINNNFPSFKYHFLERSTNAYSIKYTLEYLGALPFIAGPLISLILIYASGVTKSSTPMDRAMKFTLWGTYIFFLVMTFKGRVEGNWTIITLVPLLYLGYHTIVQSARLTRLTILCFLVSLPLIFITRLIITAHISVPIAALSERMNPRDWCNDVRQRTGDKPAVFINSYQRASLYEFYENIPAYSLNNFWGRKNQFTLWDTEADFQGKSVALISNWEMANLDTVFIEDDYYPYMSIDNFRATSNLVITSDIDGRITCAARDTIRTNVNFDFSSAFARDLEANAEYRTLLLYAFFQGDSPAELTYTDIEIRNTMIGSGGHPVKIIAPANPGRYFLVFAAGTGWLPPGINSKRVEFIVE